MTRLEDRQTLVHLITEARAGGSRQAPACALAGIDSRTIQRWRKNDGLTHGDRRPDAIRPAPSHALTEEERARIVKVANEARFAEIPPARIVPVLADEGIYIASESSFHRVLRAHGQMHRRGRAMPPRRSRPPTTHIATRPGAVWCWDVTFLPATMQGRRFYLYMILDLYSRKIVGFEVHETDSADHAAHLARRSAKAPAFPSRPDIATAVVRNEGEERSTAARSHAQRPLRREHDEDGAHRNFPDVSTMAHSGSADGPGHRRASGQTGSAG